MIVVDAALVPPAAGDDVRSWLWVDFQAGPGASRRLARIERMVRGGALGTGMPAVARAVISTFAAAPRLAA